LFHDHGSLWLENAYRFGVSKNEKIEYFLDKYLTIDQTMFSNKICSLQIHQRTHGKKRFNQFVNFNIQNHQ
jgi:hypothetical protein